MRLALLFLLFSLSTKALMAQPRSPDDTILKYEQALRDSEDKHRAYLQTLEGGAAAVVIIFTAYLGWLNWKTRKDLVADIEAEYRTAAEKAAQKYESAALRTLEQRLHELDLRIASRTLRTAAPVQPLTAAAVSRLLWVDDHPGNNREERNLIEGRWQVKIDTARSTEEAIERLKSARYDLIIEDMARQKNDRAGIKFLSYVATMPKRIPVVVYCSDKMVKRFGDEARSLGALNVTSSALSLMDTLESLMGKAA